MTGEAALAVGAAAPAPGSAPAPASESASESAVERPLHGFAARLSGVASSPVRDLLALIDRPGVLSFAGGLPAPELFDVDGLRAAYDRVLGGPAARNSLQYAPTEGDPRLRRLVADRLTRRGLPTHSTR